MEDVVEHLGEEAPLGPGGHGEPPLRVEEIRRERREGEYRRIERHAQQRDKPVRRSELFDVPQDDFVASPFLLQRQGLLTAPVKQIVNEVRQEGRKAEKDGTIQTREAAALVQIGNALQALGLDLASL